MTGRAASLLPSLPINRPEHHPCCPEEPKDEAVPPETPRVPCEAPTILFKVERHEVALAPVFAADLLPVNVSVNDLVLWTGYSADTHLVGTDLLHALQRLTC